MNSLKWLKIRWNYEEIKNWKSIVKVLYILLPVLLYSLLQDVAELILWALLDYGAGLAGDQAIAFIGLYSDTVQGMIYGMAAIVSLLPFKALLKNEITHVMSEGELPHAEAVKKYFLIALLGAGAAFALNLAFGLLPAVAASESYGQVADRQYGVTFIVGLFLYGVISPVTEELVYRGIAYQRMKRSFGVLPAMLFSAALFGALHGNWVQASYGMLMGLLLAWVYEKNEGILASVVVHIAANIGVYALTYGNRLAGISTKTSLTVLIICVMITVVCFWQLQKVYFSKCRKNEL